MRNMHLLYALFYEEEKTQRSACKKTNLQNTLNIYVLLMSIIHQSDTLYISQIVL